MVCPYCNTRNTPHAIVCSHCGAILKDARAKMRPEKKFSIRNLILTILIYCTFGILVGLVGTFVGKELAGDLSAELTRKDAVEGLGIGFVVGLAIVYLVTTGRYLIYNTIYRNQSKKLTSELKHRAEHAQERIDEALKENSPDGRVESGILHLMNDEVENGVQQFEQAQRHGIHSEELLNAFGVALARRGALDTAIDKFNQALTVKGHSSSPQLNLANAMLQTRDANFAEKAVYHIKVAADADNKNPQPLFRLAGALSLAGKRDEALSAVKQAMDAGGRDYSADGRNLTGVIHLRGGDATKAMEEFRAAVAIEPGHSHAMANQGVVYLRQKRTFDAIERLEETLLIDPKLGKARCDYGCALLADYSINEGIRELRESIVLNPLLIESYYNLGKAYADQKLYQYAERYYTTALKINPRLWQACVGMGIIHYYLGPVEKAIAWYREAERLAPNEAAVSGGLALCHALEKDFETAEQRYLKAIEADPKHAESLANIGWIYIEMEKIETAADFIERALAVSPNIAGALNNLALCNIHMGAFDLALKHFKRALESDRELHVVHYNLGHVFLVLKDVDAAIKEWKVAAQVEPDMADIYVNLGVGYFRKKEFEQAVFNFKKALTIRSDRITDIANLALAYARLGRYPEAIEQFDKALAIEPNSPMLHSNRGLACYFAKRVEEAMKEWRAVAQLSKAYFEKRSSKQQSEYDESGVDFIPLFITERAVPAAPSTGDFLFALLPGYSTDRWELKASDPDLAAVPDIQAKLDRVQRSLHALKLG